MSISISNLRNLDTVIDRGCLEKTIVVHVTMMAGQIAARGEFVFCAVKDGKGVAHGLEQK